MGQFIYSTSWFELGQVSRATLAKHLCDISYVDISELCKEHPSSSHKIMQVSTYITHPPELQVDLGVRIPWKGLQREVNTNCQLVIWWEDICKQADAHIKAVSFLWKPLRVEFTTCTHSAAVTASNPGVVDLWPKYKIFTANFTDH